MNSHIEPSRGGFETFKRLPGDEPIHMLNLLRYRDLAEYPEGHDHADKGWSGRRAYREYARTSAAVFTRVGGVIGWQGVFDCTVIGPTDEQWDDGFVAQYPSAAAFLEMIADPEYQHAAVNRTAALVDSRLIRFSPR